MVMVVVAAVGRKRRGSKIASKCASPPRAKRQRQLGYIGNNTRREEKRTLRELCENFATTFSDTLTRCLSSPYVAMKVEVILPPWLKHNESGVAIYGTGTSTKL